MSYVTVRLSPGEIRMAAEMGITRQISNLLKNRPDAHGCPANVGWQVHIEGCLGEMALAKHLDLFWGGNFENLDADDVGRYQVRTSDRHNNRLIIHPSDPDDRAFVLVTGVAPEYRIHGWIRAGDAKRDEWWADPSRKNRPAYFVPQDSLHDPHTVPGHSGLPF